MKEKYELQIKELEEKLAETNEKYLRSLADYKNLSNRFEDERKRATELANEKLMKDITPTISDIEIALEHTKDLGLKKIYEKLLKILKENGLTEMEIVINETEFNPEFHEAIDTAEGKENKIIKIYRKGYLLNSKVLHSALVSVGQNTKKIV